MSRHRFDCEHEGKRIRITLGYDRPLHEYFLQVHILENESDDPAFLYASLDDAEAVGDDLGYFREKLHALGIVVPESLFEQVDNDAVQQVGNKVVEHFAAGSYRVLVSDEVDSDDSREWERSREHIAHPTDDIEV